MFLIGEIQLISLKHLNVRLKNQHASTSLSNRRCADRILSIDSRCKVLKALNLKLKIILIEYVLLEFL